MDNLGMIHMLEQIAAMNTRCDKLRTMFDMVNTRLNIVFGMINVWNTERRPLQFNHLCLIKKASCSYHKEGGHITLHCPSFNGLRKDMIMWAMVIIEKPSRMI